MRGKLMIAVLGGLLIGLSLSQMSPLPIACSQEGKTTKKSAATAAPASDLDVLKTLSGKFEKAFNAGDAKAIAAQFTENAEAVDDDGNILQGRSKIEARFAAAFKDNPQVKTEVEITSLRQLSPEVAVEDGFSTLLLAPAETPSRSPYMVIYVKRDAKWSIASVRDFPEEASEETAHEQLEPLAFLLGHWVDQSSEGRVETTCQWSEDGNFLLLDYVIKTQRGVELRGTQRIGYDLYRHTVRSWAFDQSGAFMESTWTPVEGNWVIKAAGVTPGGKPASTVRVLTPITDDSFQIDSTSQLVGEELRADSAVRVVRRPPDPESEMESKPESKPEEKTEE